MAILFNYAKKLKKKIFFCCFSNFEKVEVRLREAIFQQQQK